MPSIFSGEIEQYRNPNVDPKMISEIQKSGVMLSEQGGASNFMADWGGADVYKQLAKMPEADRLTYVAINKGFANSDEISVVTGLSTKEIDKSVKTLQKKGLITLTTTETEKTITE